MGCASSKSGITATIGSNGDDKAYHDRYLEDRVLGQGEFGKVRLVHDMRLRGKPEAVPLACKALKKGFTYRDNTIYAPLKPEVLQRECRILRALGGKCYNLRLEGLYESGSTVYVITEYCAGGEMMPYVTGAYPDGIRTEDASRIAYQLLSALDHCCAHGVIHRDIKPENIMFTTPERGAELRVIDYGSGTIDEPSAFNKDKIMEESGLEKAPAKSAADNLITHTTFAGSAFYISPEMFNRTYTQRTDVWSAGVTLYVLVAGYPADELQKAFNMMQKSKNRDLRNLPGMPDMPDSYFEMLDQLLTYKHKNRKSAGEIMGCEFVRFHQDMDGDDDGGAEIGLTIAESGDDVGLSLADVAATAAAGGGTGSTRNGSTRGKGNTQSILIEGSVRKHAAYLEYGKFERALTTLLATMLTFEDLTRLLDAIDEQLDQNSPPANPSDHGSIPEASGHSIATGSIGDSSSLIMSSQAKLQVMKVRDVHKLLQSNKFGDVADMVQELPNYSAYVNFAYHVALLRVFQKKGKGSSKGERKRRSSITKRAQSVFNRDDEFDTSIHSDGPSSVHGGNVWQSINRPKAKPLERANSSGHLNKGPLF